MCDRRERHPCTQDRLADSRQSRLATNPEVATGYRKDMTAVQHRSLRGGHRQPAGHPGGLRGTQATAEPRPTPWSPLRRCSDSSSRSRPASAAAGSCSTTTRTANSVQAYDGREVAPAAATENYLRWISDTDRTEPKPDARASGPLHRRAGHPADAAGRPQRARQDRVARPVHPRRDDGRRRLRHQPAARRRDRRRRAAAEGRPRGRRVLPQSRRQPEGRRDPADQPGILKDVGRHRIRPAVVLHRRHRQAPSWPRRPTPRAAAPRA